MDTPARLGAFGAGLVAVLGLGAAVGAGVGPSPTSIEAEAPAPVGEGVVSAADGYRLVPATTNLDPSGGAFRFVIHEPGGAPQIEFTPFYERDLHLIVVNRELTTYAHLHPALGASGTWSIELPAMPAGSYRAVADFQPAGGPRLALGTDLAVGGAYTPTRMGPPTGRAVVDGYDVRLATEQGDGGEVTATLSVSKGGQPVDLQPYLGAGGHLVAMRSGDLAYAHVHPLESHADSAGDGTERFDGTVRFDATLSSAGRYALFFDFKHAGRVRTAAFTFDQGVVADASEMEH